MRKIDTPSWLKKRILTNANIVISRTVISECGVSTVCEKSRCPNSNECFSGKKMTFMILGSRCTRSCGFCSVEDGLPEEIRTDESERILNAVERLGQDYVVITSVTRDDLADGGAGQFVKIIEKLKEFFKNIRVEILIPDFAGRRKSVELVVNARPDVLGHNIETVRRLYTLARKGADYDRSLGLLKAVKEINPTQITKSGIMLGLGEVESELIDTMTDIRMSGCDIIAIGQYLRPGAKNLPVRDFVKPEQFNRYRKIGYDLGFRYVVCGTFVRSSYGASEYYREVCDEGCYASVTG